MQNIKQIRKRLSELFSTQYFGVLATRKEEHLHTSLVAFCSSDDLKHIIFATPKSTRKYANLCENPTVSIFIDNRTNDTADLAKAMGVTVTGVAETITGLSDKEQWIKFYSRKHPHLKDFVTSPNTALIKINVKKYDIVTQFQNVVILEIEQEETCGT